MHPVIKSFLTEAETVRVVVLDPPQGGKSKVQALVTRFSGKRVGMSEDGPIFSFPSQYQADQFSGEIRKLRGYAAKVPS